MRSILKLVLLALIATEARGLTFSMMYKTDTEWNIQDASEDCLKPEADTRLPGPWEYKKALTDNGFEVIDVDKYTFSDGEAWTMSVIAKKGENIFYWTYFVTLNNRFYFKNSISMCQTIYSKMYNEIERYRINYKKQRG